MRWAGQSSSSRILISLFLYDTNHRAHFDDQVRTFSSGCIRIEYPVEFERLVLDDPDWNDKGIQGVIETGQTKTVYLNEPLPLGQALQLRIFNDTHGAVSRQMIRNLDNIFNMGTFK